MTRLRAAREQHHPATLYWAVWFDRPPGTLIPEDVLLAYALQDYEDGLCGGCGQPARIAHTALGEGEYEALETVCHACAARDRHREQHKNPQPGALLRLLPAWFQPKSERKSKAPSRRRRAG